jgi:hypothetical protein
MTRRISRIITRRLEAEGNSKRVLKPEKDQGYASVLPAARVKKQPQSPGIRRKSQARTA